MKRFPEKLRDARKLAGLSQTELANMVGITQRSMTAYESGRSLPRKNMLRKLAEALNVTVEYLSNDETDDPNSGRQREERVNSVRTMFGNKGAKEMEELLDRNVAFLAGGDVPQESKDAFFDALMTAYVTCKNEAREKFTPADKKKAGDPE